MFEVIMGLAGGLGLFLYGIFLMSDSLEKAAGPKLRNILEYLTKNRFVGILVGTAFTAIIQSSSATTVMVVSFVNARLMTLMQAAGVIMALSRSALLCLYFRQQSSSLTRFEACLRRLSPMALPHRPACARQVCH